MRRATRRVSVRSDSAFRELQDLQASTPNPLFTFLGDEIVFGRLPLRELRGWDWSQRLAQAGIQRLEFRGHGGPGGV